MSRAQGPPRYGADQSTVTAEVDRLVDEAVGFLGGLESWSQRRAPGRTFLGRGDDRRALPPGPRLNIGPTFRTVRAAIPHLRAAGSRPGRDDGLAGRAQRRRRGSGRVRRVESRHRRADQGAGQGARRRTGTTVNALAPGFIGDTAFHDTFTPPEAQNDLAGIAVRPRRHRRGRRRRRGLALLGRRRVHHRRHLDIDGGVWSR